MHGKEDSENFCQDEPIAIVGMGCRLPGGVSSPSKLWDLLSQGRSAHDSIPSSRFNASSFYHPKLENSGTINATGGYFINEDIRAFENAFFGINNMEAKYMDPQQRKLLEVVYECFESAGVPLHQLFGANVGCYVANFTGDFGIIQSKDPEAFHHYSATGMGLTILANRISHVFNLQGPSFVLDTACSSSLYCLHAACVALEGRECDAAVVAGANLIQSPEVHIGTVKTGVLSKTSTCHTFDSSADGYGRAEGVGALFLKRLNDALRDGDPIRSVIRGTAVNSNGRTNGITLPSGAGQAAVIRKAYAKARLPVNETDYIEAHGTGTPVGDPIEVEALSTVFGSRPGHPITLGSIKSNIGHSEAVSGISSVIKTTLALEHRMIPPTIGIRTLNPALRLDERNMRVAQELECWPKEKPPRASINSFGYGGANAHAILESADLHIPQDYGMSLLDAETARTTFVLPFSASSKQSLDARVSDIASLGVEQPSLVDLAYNLGCRRTHFSQRGFLIVHKDTRRTDLALPKLRTLERSLQTSLPPFAFVFTGQGAQWPEMGRHLSKEFPSYGRTIRELDQYLARLPCGPSWTIQEILDKPRTEVEIHVASRSQPLCTATQIALVELLKEWNIVPEVVVGHSSGEIAAAFAAGHLSASQAITNAYYRGLVVSKSSLNGAMAAISLDQDSAIRHILDAGLQAKIQVACINSPKSVTVSGDSDAVHNLISGLQKQCIFSRMLKTNGIAYHSHHMSALGDEYERLLRSVIDQPLHNVPVRMVSSVTGQLVTADTTRASAYWRRNLESPVLFSSTVTALLSGQAFHLVEIGPHPALKLPIREIQQSLDLAEGLVIYSSTLARGEDCIVSMLRLTGTLFLHGYDINFGIINSPDSALKGATKPKAKDRTLHNLPNYNWDYGLPLWHEPRVSTEYRTRKYPPHELLGSLVPGRNGKSFLWRNLLKAEEVPWLGDHQLGRTVVFPAAGYLATAIEALCQVNETDVSNCPTVTLRQVKFINAFVISDQPSGKELFTEMRRLQLSHVASSSNWWIFQISSVVEAITTVHASGRIGFDYTGQTITQDLFFSGASMDEQPMHKWYKKMASQRINAGPSFQSLTQTWTDRMRKSQSAISNTRLFEKVSPDCEQRSQYLIHPVNIDASLQTAYFATTAGSVQSLKGKVPVSIARVKMKAASRMLRSDVCSIRGISKFVGFETTKSDTELYDPEGNVLLQMNDVRTTPYQEGVTVNECVQERYPMLRISWKPDPSTLSSRHGEIFNTYIDKFTSIHVEMGCDFDFTRLAGALDLLSHKNPNSRILEIGSENSFETADLLRFLHAGSSLKRFKSYTKGYITDCGKLVGRDVQSASQLPTSKIDSYDIQETSKWDIVLMPSFEACSGAAHLEYILSFLAPGASIVLSTSTESLRKLSIDCTSFSMLSSTSADRDVQVVMATSLERGKQQASPVEFSIILVGRSDKSNLNQELKDILFKFFNRQVSCISMNEVSSATIPAKSIIISTIELYEPFLSVLSAHDLERLQILTDSASIMLWMTGGGLLKAKRPDFSPVFGLSRALMLEQPSLKFPILDIDSESPEEIAASKVNIPLILNQVLRSTMPDLEYLQYNGVLHISRFVPDEPMNKTFQQKIDKEATIVPLHSAGPCELNMNRVGQMDTLHFVQTSRNSKPLLPDYLEVHVKCVGLNAKDIYFLSGKADTKDAMCSAEFSGVVSKIGSAVTDFVPGDRVVVMAPHRFATWECVPQWTCCKLQDGEDFATLSTLPIVFSTALYALKYRAGLQPGESVLIHSAAGGVGIAAIQIAQLQGAEVFATVGTYEKKQFLVSEFGLRPDHIFSSRDSTFLPSVMAATSGRGVDVALNSLTGDLLHDSWRALAEFGRFVEIGKRDILEGGNLDMDIFERNVTFTAFDLSNLFHSSNTAHHAVFTKLLYEGINLVRDGKVRPVSPLKIFDVSELSQAIRYFSLGSRMGKVVVSLRDSESPIKIVRKKYETVFSPDKAYLMVGCLGGLGRSLSRWMFHQGARKFVFLSRSGTKKIAAKQLVQDLQENGASIDVMVGDVSVFADVEAVVSQINGSVGGIIHAAMGLDEALFTSMSSESWHKSIGPKIQGSWNLYNAIRGRQDHLEFFLLTSSISGSVGTATESNYCAANGFLDAFACYLRSVGIPAIAIGLGMISEVGYLHEHPEIETLLLRKGLHAISEDELLQICDIALAATASSKLYPGSCSFSDGHLLTGLEAQGLQSIRNRGFEGSSHVLDDPRASIMAGALSSDHSNDTENLAEHSSRLPEQIVAALSSGDMAEATLLQNVQVLVAQKTCNLLLLQAQDLEAQTQLSRFGMDSMLAAELRQFIYHTFEVDISFLTLLAKSTSIASLAELIARQLRANTKI